VLCIGAGTWVHLGPNTSRSTLCMRDAALPESRANKEPRIDKTLLLYRGEKSAKPHRENQRNRRECPLFIERQKKPKM